MASHSASPRVHLRVFLSSPGDVADERGLALTVVDRLQYDPFLRGRVTFEAVAWDMAGGVPLLATATPQASIDAGLPRPSDCDIVAVLLWSRMGTPLSYPEYQKADGTPYSSGTEWEFEDALRGAQERGTPAVLVYRRTARILQDLEALDLQERLRQKQLVDEFFGRMKDPRTGAMLRGYRTYETPEDFRTTFESDLRTLTHRILNSDLVPPKATEPTPARPAPLWEGSPFPGLRAFTPHDAPIFYGRGRETDELLARVADSRFVAVVGASGSGKSSIVGAGLIPRLLSGAAADTPKWLLPSYDPRTKQWEGLRFTPGELGDNCFLALAVKLAPLVGEPPREIVSDLAGSPEHIVEYLVDTLDGLGAGAEVLLFVDQFEELFTLVADRHLEPFISLLEAVSRSPNGRAVVTLRSDFYHRCLEVPALAHLLERGQYPLSTPGDTLYEMITRPAERAGLRFEEGLAGRILRDTGPQAGGLPLLAYTLDELHRTCADTGTLTFTAYERLGGVQGAIGTRAEEIFVRLDEAARGSFPEVFPELIEVDEQGRATRRRVLLTEVAPDEHARRLVEVFTDARLLVKSQGGGHEPIVFLAHEALFSSWARLRLWIRIVQDDLWLLRQVRLAARDWQQSGRQDAYLWPHERLAPVYEMCERLRPALDPLIVEFIRPEHERLLKTLRDRSTKQFQRQFIADRLVTIGQASVPGLLQALHDQDEAVREAAGSALARLGNPAIPGLRSALLDAAPWVRLSAIMALRQLANQQGLPDLADALQQALPDLVDALGDEDVRVRSAAAGTLETVGDASAVELVAERLAHAEVDERWRAVGVLGAFGESAVPPLLASLRDPDEKVRTTAWQALQAVGKTGVQPLLTQGLRHSEGVIRAGAAAALAQLGDAAAPGLKEALNDEDADVRWRAIEALAAIGDREAEPLLAQALTDPAAMVRAAAAGVLRMIGTAAAVPSLIQALADDDMNMRWAAAEALAAIGQPAIEPLIAALRRPNMVGALAAAALGDIGPSAVPDLVAALQADDDHEQWVRLRIAAALAMCGPASVSALLMALRDGNEQLRQVTAATLAAIGEPAIKGLAELAGAPDPSVRRAVAVALGSIASPKAKPVLVQFLADGDRQCREIAADNLGAMGTDALPALLHELQHPEASDRAAVIRALTRVGGAAVPALLSTVHQPNKGTSAAALEALHAISSPAALFGLAEFGLAGATRGVRVGQPQE